VNSPGKIAPIPEYSAGEWRHGAFRAFRQFHQTLIINVSCRHKLFFIVSPVQATKVKGVDSMNETTHQGNLGA
jgi:hypothetical protein